MEAEEESLADEGRGWVGHVCCVLLRVCRIFSCRDDLEDCSISGSAVGLIGRCRTSVQPYQTGPQTIKATFNFQLSYHSIVMAR